MHFISNEALKKGRDWKTFRQKFGKEALLSAWDSLSGLVEAVDPWGVLVLFILASFLMIWQLGAMERKGVEGTVLGTLIMPYCTGLSNLIFAFILGRSGGSGSIVLENCIVNNVTNLTLIIGLPAIFWGMNIFPKKKVQGDKKVGTKHHRLNYLSLLLTLIAIVFFTGIVWALARDGQLDFSDGMVLVGAFIFWQVFHVFDVLKHNVHRGKSFNKLIIIDIILVAIAACGIYISIEELVNWVSNSGTGFFAVDQLGWLSGWLMVVPNALLAIYYTVVKRADIVYSSQVGDGHICIPMCIGLFALFGTIKIPSYFELGIIMILGSTLVHFLFVAFLGRLPRLMGFAFTGTYFYFLYEGLIK